MSVVGEIPLDIPSSWVHGRSMTINERQRKGVGRFYDTGTAAHLQCWDVRDIGVTPDCCSVVTRTDVARGIVHCAICGGVIRGQ